MSVQKGWIKLYRSIWENPRSGDAEWVAVWLYLLCEASHSGGEAMWKGQRIRLKPGQLVTGRKRISEKTGVNESKVFRVLTVLKTEQQIEQQTSNVSSLISITNWTAYQEIEQPFEQPSNSHRTTIEQPVNTVQECKKEKKGRTEAVCSEQSSSPPEIDFPLSSGKLWRLPLEVWWTLETTYPDVKLRQACMEALAWLRANPKKRKTPRGMATFLTSWVQREAKDARLAKESGAVVRFPRAASPETEPGREAFELVMGGANTSSDEFMEVIFGVKR